jgi:hypothetical protein
MQQMKASANTAIFILTLSLECRGFHLLHLGITEDFKAVLLGGQRHSSGG